MDDMLGGNRTVAKSGNKGSGLSAKLQKQTTVTHVDIKL
jgi:hypothetical protein